MVDNEADPASHDSDYDDLPIPQIDVLHSDGITAVNGADAVDRGGEWFVS
jgi:hypothetical protein